MLKRTAQRRTRKRCRILRKFVTDGNEKADELAKTGAMLDEGFMAADKSKSGSAGARRGVRSLAVRSQFSLQSGGRKDCEELKPQPKEKWTCVDKKREGSRHRMEWCAAVSKYHMRCGRGSNYMKMPGKCTGPKYLSKVSGRWRKQQVGGHDMERRMDRQGEVFDLVQKNARLAHDRKWDQH